MNQAPPQSAFCSRPFLLVWVLLPLGALLGAVAAGLHDFDPHLLVSCLALALAGVWFPIEMRHRELPAFWPIGLLLLFVAPIWVAAGRLAGVGWKAGVSFLLIGAWLAFAWALSKWKNGDRARRMERAGLFFVLLAGLPPLLAFLSRNFGGSDWPRLAGVSPFVSLFRLESGKGWEIGCGVSLGLLLLSWARWRVGQEVQT